MNLRPLQYFVVLAEELNFSRAAERLHVAQPALSQQIRNLEKRLGAELVDRGRRPLRLTEAGHYLCTEARQLLDGYEKAALGTREIGLGARGWLAIGFTRSSMYSILPPALKAFHRAYPRIELKLLEMVTEEQADALRDARIHVGIGRQPTAIAGCTTLPVLRERVMVALTPDHPIAAAAEVRIADVADSPLVLYPKYESAEFSRFIESLYRDAGFIPPVAHRAFEIQTAIALVAAGLGVTFIGESVARHGRSDAVPPLLGVVGTFLISRGSDRSGERKKHLGFVYGVSAIAIAGSAYAPNSFLAYALLCVTGLFIYAGNSLFWSLASSFRTGAAGAATIALINTIAQLGGVVGPWSIGLIRGATGSFDMALPAIAAFLVVATVIAFTMRVTPAGVGPEEARERHHVTEEPRR